MSLKGAELIWDGWGKEAGKSATGGWAEVLREGRGRGSGGYFAALPSLSDSDPLQDLSGSCFTFSIGKEIVSQSTMWTDLEKRTMLQDRAFKTTNNDNPKTSSYISLDVQLPSIFSLLEALISFFRFTFCFCK